MISVETERSQPNAALLSLLAITFETIHNIYTYKIDIFSHRLPRFDAFIWCRESFKFLPRQRKKKTRFEWKKSLKYYIYNWIFFGAANWMEYYNACIIHVLCACCFVHATLTFRSISTNHIIYILFIFTFTFNICKPRLICYNYTICVCMNRMVKLTNTLFFHARCFFILAGRGARNVRSNGSFIIKWTALFFFSVP